MLLDSNFDMKSPLEKVWAGLFRSVVARSIEVD